MEPRVVLGADEVESATVEPRDNEGAVAAQRLVDVGRLEACRTAPNAEAGSPPVLGLYGEKPLYDTLDGSPRCAGEHLRRQPGGDNGRLASGFNHGRDLAPADIMAHGGRLRPTASTLRVHILRKWLIGTM
jgi:hypothetical protein